MERSRAVLRLPGSDGAAARPPRLREVDVRRALATAILLLLVTASGCGVYSTRSGRVREDIRQVAVPYLENLSSESGIEIELTEAIIEAIEEEGSLRVVGEESADSILSGAVIRYAIREAYINPNQVVNEFQVQIAVELDLQVRATGEYLFQDRRITGAGNYLIEGGSSSEQTARLEAAEQIVRDVLGTIMEGW